MQNNFQQIDFSQLWPSEQRTLFERASLVPDEGVIVDIGTAQGGSPYIFHAAAGHRRVRIYSFDIAPSADAYEHLKGTSVSVIAKPSIEVHRCGQKR
jgi:predicted O-methyltransferase YrrM